jgi:phospholipid/cholesterol/gamma-HCH transport system permease protein
VRGRGRDSSRHPERSEAGVDAFGVGDAGSSADERGAGRWTFHVERPASEVVRVELAGVWRKENWLPDPSDVWREIQAGPAVHRLTFDTSRVTDWDSGLVTFARRVLEEARARGIESDRTGLPDGAQRLLRLAEAVPERQTGRVRSQPPWLVRIGAWATAASFEMVAGLAFLGEGLLAFGALLRGRARFRMVDLFAIIQECGPRALGIVSLISFLIGLILGFVGAVQLAQFGASIFVANLVAVAMTREIACIMTAIVMAGRTGAAFAAQLGTMTTNQEIDALDTMGISPMQFLVLPRMVALILMMPLLTIYADIVGILGGAVVGVAMLGLGPTEYFEQTRAAMGLTSFFIGVSKSVVFGVLVALVGCLRGMQSGRSAEAVGLAATSAVVTSIVLIIVVDGIFAVILNVLGL